MNWLAHILLSEPNVENRLGNLLGDLVKGKDLDELNCNLRRGVNRHYAIDKFTGSHPIVKIEVDFKSFFPALQQHIQG
jgi:acyl carrier protein phosphodiesterase